MGYVRCFGAILGTKERGTMSQPPDALDKLVKKTGNFACGRNWLDVQYNILAPYLGAYLDP